MFWFLIFFSLLQMYCVWICAYRLLDPECKQLENSAAKPLNTGICSSLIKRFLFPHFWQQSFSATIYQSDTSPFESAFYPCVNKHWKRQTDGQTDRQTSPGTHTPPGTHTHTCTEIWNGKTLNSGHLWISKSIWPGSWCPWGLAQICHCFPACLLYRTHINDLTTGDWSTGQVYN